MKQKNCSFFCLLMSTMLLLSFSSIFAAVTVTYQNGSFPYNTTGNVITAKVQTTEDIAAFDLLTKVRSTVTSAFGTITAVNVSAVAGAVANTSKVNGTSEDTTRIYGFNCATPVIMPIGTYNFTFTVTTSCDTGLFVLEDGGQWLVDPDPVIATTDFVNTSSANATVTVVPGTYRVFNSAPTVTNCPAGAIVFNACAVVTYNFTATDPDDGHQCQPALDYTWSVVSGPGSIDNAGHFVWGPPAIAGICGLHSVVVKVTDEYGASATCSFDVSLQSDAPTFTQCPTPGSETHIYAGWTADGGVAAVDPDNCPLPLAYSLNNFTGPVTAGPFTVNPVTGVWSWPTAANDDAYLGTFTATIDVTDGCNTAQCSFTIHVSPTYQVLIEKTHNTLQGHYEYVDISLIHWTEGFGGYDFLISYDNSGLSFLSADPGLAGSSILLNCGFEYFQYRFGALSNCHNSCPSGLLRIVAIADYNNGANHPSCYGQGHPSGPSDPISVLARLKFLVSGDRTFACQYLPIQFWWQDCGDNSISSITGDTLFIDKQVFRYSSGGPAQDITGQPGYGGWQGIEGSPDCMHLLAQKYLPDTVVIFSDGGVDVVCADSIDARGDINVNGIPNEIADAVLYTNYFLYGISVFHAPYVEAQIEASDVNNDGTTLSVGDLVYLLRIITGDALPFAKLTSFNNATNVDVVNGKLSTTSSDEIGALYLTYKVTGSVNVTPLTSMKVDYNQTDDGILHVLVYSGMDNMKNKIPSGTNELLTVSGAELSSVEISDYYGNLMNARVEKTALPTAFALHQNVPNPFNPTTKIGLDLPVASDWKIDIYNVNGQLVQSYNGTNIGHVEVTWDASRVASGIYFYKVSAGNFSETKKMVLMK